MTAPPDQPEPTARHSLVRRLGVLFAGMVVVTVGVFMIVLPGPATVVIPLGLAILATEFLWARRLLNRLKEQGSRLIGRTPPAEGGPAPPAETPK